MNGMPEFSRGNMDLISIIEPWRKSMNIPELSHEDFEKLRGNKRIREFLMNMTQRIASVERKALAQSAWVYKELSDKEKASKEKDKPLGKRISNARRLQMLEERIKEKYREISCSEQQARYFNLEMKNLSEKIQYLSQSIEEKEKKNDLVLLYYKEMLRKRDDTSCLLNYVRETLETLEQTRDIKGHFASLPEKMEFKRVMRECLWKVCDTMKCLEQARLSDSLENILCQMGKAKQGLIHFLWNELNQYPWTYILQYILNLQDEKKTKINALIAAWVRFKIVALCNKENEKLDELLKLDSYTIKWDLNKEESTWEYHFQMVKEKLEEVRNLHHEAKAEVEELHTTAHREMRSHKKRIMMALKHFPQSLEKLHAAYMRMIELDMGLGKLSVSIQNLNSSAYKELKMFADIPLLCLDKMAFSNEKIDSYRSLSHFNEIPRDVINVCGWVTGIDDRLLQPPHILAEDLFFQVQFLRPMRHTLQIMSNCALSPFEGVDEERERKKFNHREICQNHSSFADTLSQLEQVFYNLLELHKFIWEQRQASFIPPKLTLRGKSAEEWQYFLKLYFKKYSSKL